MGGRKRRVLRYDTVFLSFQRFHLESDSKLLRSKTATSGRVFLFCFVSFFFFFREKKMPRYLGGLYQARPMTDDLRGTNKLTVPKFRNISSVTSVNLKKAGMASRNIVVKNNTRCFKSALQ